eukprot:7074935-Prymnesium_polylepis.1
MCEIGKLHGSSEQQHAVHGIRVEEWRHPDPLGDQVALGHRRGGEGVTPVAEAGGRLGRQLHR